jgi:hypothetical protein
LFNNLQKYIEKKNNFHIVVAYIISLLLSLCIFIINFIFEKILDFLTKKEKQTTTTNYYLSKSIKLTIFSFMNYGIVPLISEIYISTKGYEYLIINMFMIFTINSFLVPISWTINFTYFYKKFRIWLIERKDDINLDENHEKTQRELNELYELPSMNIAEKYSYIYNTLLISFFYISIFPLGIVISFFGLCLGYYLEKFNFCHMYKRPEMLNDLLCKTYINYFIIVLFVSGIGDYIFKYDVYYISIWPIINIIIFGVLIIIPYQYLVNFIVRAFFQLNESEYHKYNLDDVYYSFFNDYERANPMTKREGIANYLKGLQKRGIITDYSLNKQLNNLNNVNLMKLYYADKNKHNILKAQKTLIKTEKNNYIYNIITRTLSMKTSISLEDKKEKNKKETSRSLFITDTQDTNNEREKSSKRAINKINIMNNNFIYK